MDQIKIGRFIAERRKRKNMTQMQLAEKLGVTDRAISKWERGKGMPDSAIMLDLCNELEINVNELLSGELIDANKYNQKAEEKLLKMAKEKEIKDHEFLNIEILISVLVTIILLICVFSASFLNLPTWARFLIEAAGFIPFIIGIAYAVRIEQIAGYYECQHCHCKYVPKYNQVLFSIHSGRTRYMKCPECGKMSWQKKIIK